MSVRADFASERDGALYIDVRAVPRASRDRVGPVVDGALRVAVSAPPVDGEANAAVVELLAQAFGVRRSAVEVVHGERGRRKTVRILGATRATLFELLAQRERT
ncbi:MAG TPA: DUF167 domain-containing protein [Polyangiaceae bacterium]|jgi:hypothetical protein